MSVEEAESSIDLRTSEEVAQEWVGWLKDDVERLKEMEGIDFERAARGGIVNGIGSDAVGGFYSASLIAIHGDGSKRDLELIKNSVETAWLKYTISIGEFGTFLPEACLGEFHEIFIKYKEPIGLLLGSETMEGIETVGIIEGVAKRIVDIFRDPPGMAKGDLRYAIDLLNPELKKQ